MTDPTADGAPLVVEAEGLRRTFDDGQRSIRVLDGLDLKLKNAEKVAVVGESGAGKSTLLHLLGALDRPDSGDVRLNGRSLFGLDAAELSLTRNQAFGFVFQFHHLLGDFDAVENVMLPLLIANAGRGEARRRAFEVLDRVGMAERLNHRPGELSGGEQQRVAVARAVVGGPKIILADEPTGNLDPGSAEEVQALLISVQRQLGCCLVVATHSASLARSMDRILRLEKGSLREEGAV